MARAHDIDVVRLADWLTVAGDHLWTVDGEPRISGALPLPASGRDLAALLRRRGGRVRVHSELDAADGSDISTLSANDDGEISLELEWLGDDATGDRWTLATDRLAEEADRAAVGT